jgi:hypothetical protein
MLVTLSGRGWNNSFSVCELYVFEDKTDVLKRRNIEVLEDWII